MTSWGCTGQLFVCGWAMLAVSTTWHVQDRSRSSEIKFQNSPKKVPCKSCVYSYIIVTHATFCSQESGSKLPWQSESSCMKPKFLDEKITMVRLCEIVACLQYDVCCALHRVSQVMCLLPGLGPGRGTELHSDGAVFDEKKHRRWRVKGLVFGLFGEDGVMRGKGVKKGTGRIETQPFKGKLAVQRWISGADAQKGTTKVSLSSQVVSW